MDTQIWAPANNTGLLYSNAIKTIIRASLNRLFAKRALWLRFKTGRGLLESSLRASRLLFTRPLTQAPLTQLRLGLIEIGNVLSVYRDQYVLSVDHYHLIHIYLVWRLTGTQDFPYSLLTFSRSIIMGVVTPTNKEVLDFKGLHLYHAGVSNCSMRVRLTLEEKKLPWTSHHVDLFKI